MASPLDLQEQEQLDELKAFWKQYGNLITWVLILVLGAYAAWNGWQWWQRSQAVKATALADELQRAGEAGDVDRVARAAADLRAQHARTIQAAQGTLLAARLQADKGDTKGALESLAWVAEHAGDDDYKGIARLRAAGMQIDAKQYDAAAQQLDAVKQPSLQGLVADRRGDLAMAQGKLDDARSAYQSAWKAMDAKLEYRQLVAAKLTALGAAPEPPLAQQVAAATAAAGAAASSTAAAAATGASR